jgi:MoxR-like ATPase
VNTKELLYKSRYAEIEVQLTDVVGLGKTLMASTLARVLSDAQYKLVT